MATVTRIPVDVEKLIHSLDEKLPRYVIGYQQKPYLELWKVSVEYFLQPIYKKRNHKRKMRLAWLANGGKGLIDYIEPFIRNKRKFEQIRIIILAIK